MILLLGSAVLAASASESAPDGTAVAVSHPAPAQGAAAPGTAPDRPPESIRSLVLRAEVFAAEQPERRERAARALEDGLASAASNTGDERASLGPLLAAANAARIVLLDGEMARRIERAVEAARWRALFDVERANDELVSELRAIASDLAFEPFLEAELPAGFPAPTMVGEIELRSYPRYRMATAPMDGGRTNGAFWKLFQHITTNDIPMTAPVETTYAIDGERVRATTMAFLYEGPEQGSAGVDGAVEVLDAEPERVVSMGLRGSDRRERVDAAHARLLAWIAARPELEVAGDMRTMGYNSPMVRGSRRTYEVQVPVRVQVPGRARVRSEG